METNPVSLLTEAEVRQLENGLERVKRAMKAWQKRQKTMTAEEKAEQNEIRRILERMYPHL